jgi:hypothetical protein
MVALMQEGFDGHRPIDEQELTSIERFLHGVEYLLTNPDDIRYFRQTLAAALNENGYDEQAKQIAG